MDSVMQTMKKMDEFSISPDNNTFQILVKYFIKEKLYMLAYQTVNDMHSKGYQPAEGSKLFEALLLGWWCLEVCKNLTKRLCIPMIRILHVEVMYPNDQQVVDDFGLFDQKVTSDHQFLRNSVIVS